MVPPVSLSPLIPTGAPNVVRVTEERAPDALSPPVHWGPSLSLVKTSSGPFASCPISLIFLKRGSKLTVCVNIDG